MHAAHASSSDSVPGQPVSDWPLTTSLVALPPAEALPPGSMALARVLTQQQYETLGQISELVSQLAHLAEQGRCHETSVRERQNINRNFHQSLAALKTLVEAALYGTPIFSRKDWTVELDPPGNKLVVPGIHRGPERLGSLGQTDLLSSRSAAEAYQRIVELREWIALDQALVIEIRSRLSFVAVSSCPTSGSSAKNA